MSGTRTVDAVALCVALLVVWEALFAWAGSSAITPPLETVRYAASLLGSGYFWSNAAATMEAFAAALAIASVGGVGLGVLLGLRRFAGEVAEPILASLYTIPKVTLYPLMLLVFGLGISAKVAFGVIHGLVPVTLTTLAAVKAIPPVYVRAARAMRLTPWQTATRVLAPAALPEIVGGLRIGFSVTLLGVLIGEMFASQRGLGFLILNGIGLHNVPMTTAVTLLVVLFAVAANAMLLRLDRRPHLAAGGGGAADCKRV